MHCAYMSFLIKSVLVKDMYIYMYNVVCVGRVVPIFECFFVKFYTSVYVPVYTTVMVDPDTCTCMGTRLHKHLARAGTPTV